VPRCMIVGASAAGLAADASGARRAGGALAPRDAVDAWELNARLAGGREGGAGNAEVADIGEHLTEEERPCRSSRARRF